MICICISSTCAQTNFPHHLPPKKKKKTLHECIRLFSYNLLYAKKNYVPSCNYLLFIWIDLVSPFLIGLFFSLFCRQWNRGHSYVAVVFYFKLYHWYQANRKICTVCCVKENLVIETGKTICIYFHMKNSRAKKQKQNKRQWFNYSLEWNERYLKAICWGLYLDEKRYPIRAKLVEKSSL